MPEGRAPHQDTLITGTNVDVDNDLIGVFDVSDETDGTNGTSKQMKPSELANLPMGTQTLTDGATIDWNVANGRCARLTLAGNRTFNAPTNLQDGATYLLEVNQDGTGSRTITWNAVFKWASGTAPTLSTGASAKDILTFWSDGTNLYGSAVLNFS